MWNELSMAEKANIIKLGVQSGISSLDTIREVYNRYAEGGYIGDEHHPIELRGIVVYPEPYQIELKNKFANSKIRKKILDEAAFKANIPAYNNGFLDETTHPYYQTQYMKRLYDIWELAGKPKIYLKGEEPWYRPRGDRPNYHPFTNSIVIPENYGYGTSANIIAELAHPIQRKYGKRVGVIQFFRDLIPNVTDDLKRYQDKGSMEYETHSIFEPLLRNYIYKGTPHNITKKPYD